MKNSVLFFIIIFGKSFVYGQEELTNKQIDSLYREDQFYISTTYNLLGDKPTGLKQSDFSFGFHFGFIRDFPVNKKRNLAIGLGLGYSSNSVNHNLLVDTDTSGETRYSIINKDNVSFTKNKLTQNLIELPIEFRWRTSTAQDYTFWRIYAGFKIGYVHNTTTKFIGSLGKIKNRNLNDFNDFQYGLTLSAGYNAWSIYTYYGLNPIFSDIAKIDGQVLDMNLIKFGLIFYFL